jgi:hypothetical protein
MVVNDIFCKMVIRKTIENYKPIFSSERILHKGYDYKGSVWEVKMGLGAKTK